MQSDIPHEIKSNFEQTCADCKSDPENNNLNYFNENFKDNSDMNSQSSNENSETILKVTTENKSKIDEKVINSTMQSKQNITKLNTTCEKSLKEIGFNSTEAPDWNEIEQPPKEDLSDLLYDMIINFKSPDVKIIIGEKNFNCHMIVLKCYSNFFMNLKLDCECHVITLPKEQVTSDAFTLIYGWMLTKQAKVKRELILELFNAATFLKIKGILDQCWACLDDGKQFREGTAFLLYLEAGKYNHELREQIQQLMLTRISKFFLTLVATKEFLEMSAEEIITLFESNTIGVNSETEVLMAAVRWFHYDFANRQQYIVRVMKCVRFGLIAPWQLVELKRNTTCLQIQEIVENHEVQKMIDDGLSYVTTKYYYGSREDEFLEILKRLNLQEPVERQWICDKSWAAHEHCLNKQIITYEKFLQYLEYIRSKGGNHWKELEYNEHCPYADYHLQVRPGDNPKYFDDYCRIDKIISN